MSLVYGDCDYVYSPPYGHGKHGKHRAQQLKLNYQIQMLVMKCWNTTTLNRLLKQSRKQA